MQIIFFFWSAQGLFVNLHAGNPSTCRPSTRNYASCSQCNSGGLSTPATTTRVAIHISSAQPPTDQNDFFSQEELFELSSKAASVKNIAVHLNHMLLQLDELKGRNVRGWQESSNLIQTKLKLLRMQSVNSILLHPKGEIASGETAGRRKYGGRGAPTSYSDPLRHQLFAQCTKST